MKKKQLIAALCFSTCIGLAQPNFTNVINVVGSGPAGYVDNTTALNAKLYSPQNLTFDPAGNMYILDEMNYYIRKVDVSGNVTTVAGTGVQGPNNPTLASNLSLSNYTNKGMCCDNLGNLYIADGAYGTQVVWQIALDGNGKISMNSPVSVYAGVYGFPGYGGDNGPASSAFLNEPEVIIMDKQNNMYIADNTNGVIRKVAANGIITTLNLYNASLNGGGYSGDGGVLSNALIEGINGFAFNSIGDLYFSTYAPNNVSAIRKIAVNPSTHIIDGNSIITRAVGVLGSSSFGGDNGPALSANLNFPKGLVLDASDNLYISDYNNGRIRMVNHTTQVITTIAGVGFAQAPNYIGTGKAPLSANINPNYGLAIDKCGNLYFNEEVGNQFNPSNVISKIVNGTAPSFSPSITTNTLYCGGSNISVTGSYGGSIAPDSYSWQMQACNSAGVITGGGFNTGVITNTGAPSGAFTFPNTSTITCNQYYLVTFSVAKSCPTPTTSTVTKIIHLYCNESPTITGPINICSTSNATLTSNYAYSNNNHISWSTGATNLGTTQTITVTPTVTTTYTLTATYVPTGCTASTTFIINVVPNVPTFNLSDITTNGTYANIGAVANNSATINSAGYLYQWILEELNSDGSDNWIQYNNPASWQQLPLTTYFNGINNTPTDYAAGSFNPMTNLNSTIYGQFKYGNTYRITLESRNNTCNWAQSSQIIVPGVGHRLANGESGSLILEDHTAPDFSYLRNQQNDAGIPKLSNDNSLSLYPNPNNGNFTIEILEATPQLLQVFDINGKLVLTQNASGKTTINASGLSDGIYNLRISGDNKVVNKKLIIVK